MAQRLNTTTWRAPGDSTSFSVTVPTVAAGSKLVCISLGAAVVTAKLGVTNFTKQSPTSLAGMEIACQDIVATGGETSVTITLSGANNVDGTIYEFASGSLGAYINGAIQTGTTIDSKQNANTATVVTSGAALMFSAVAGVESDTAPARRWWGLQPLGNVTYNGHNNNPGSSKIWGQIGISDLASAGTFSFRSSHIVSSFGYQAACWAYTDTSGINSYTHETNPIKAEGSLPGTWRTYWFGASTNTNIAGFTDRSSYLPGATANFKVDSNNVGFNVEITRLGWYGHYYFGGREQAVVSGSPAVQAAPSTDAYGGKVCDGWTATATWVVPSTATPGMYLYNMRRTDNSTFVAQGLFVVRSPAPSSFRTNTIGLKVSEYTWNAYNLWGARTDFGTASNMSGRSLYGEGSLAPGGGGNLPKRAFAVNFDRPYGSVSHQTNTYFWDSEYALINFLEGSGFQVDYFSTADIDADPTIPSNYPVFTSSGHDEYWTTGLRDAFTNARQAGTHLAFFSGNTAFWRVRFDAGDTNRRKMICYKDTHDQTGYDNVTKYDPVSYTGTWRDSRTTVGGVNNTDRRPESSLTGQWFIANAPQDNTIVIPDTYKALPIWRSTAVASLGAGQSHTAKLGTIGDEWDYVKTAEASTPTNIVLVAHKDIALSGQAASDNGDVYNLSGTFRYGPSVYLSSVNTMVFNAGSWRWCVGLSRFFKNTFNDEAADYVLQQATLNILRDLGVTPGTILGAAANSQALVDPGAARSAADYGLALNVTRGSMNPKERTYATMSGR